ncbi:MAG: AAA family ATPase [Deltaproteobacteria bacterium]|jgi:general secretion pathway protein A|nr:AAA family ATPase [Deltaproteobacteria bacterium]
MYLDFFGFKERPFSITPDVQYLYMSKQHEQALDTILYGIKNRLGFSMLSGEVGTGKTLLTRALMGRLDDNVETSLLVNPLLSVPELLRAINKDFGINIRYNSPQKQIDALNEFLIGIAKDGKNAVVVIDEAQNLSMEALETIRMLTNLETDTTKLLQILLVGQPELLKKLRSHELRQLEQRITARYHLRALSQLEMIRYINHRVFVAGGGGKVFIDPKSYKLIYKETKGFPRLINVVCDKALMAAFVQESHVINRNEVRAAIMDWRGREDQSSPWDYFKRLIFSS